MNPFRRGSRPDPEPEPLAVASWRPLDARVESVWPLVTSRSVDLHRPEVLAVLDVPGAGGATVVISRYQSDAFEVGLQSGYVSPRPADGAGQQVTRDETFGISRVFWVETDAAGSRLHLEQRLLLPPAKHADVRLWLKSRGEVWLTSLDLVAAGRKPLPQEQWDAVRAAVPSLGPDCVVVTASRSFDAEAAEVWTALERARLAAYRPDAEVLPMPEHPLALGAVRLTRITRPRITMATVDEVLDVEPGVGFSARNLIDGDEWDVALVSGGGRTSVTAQHRMRTASASDAAELELWLDHLERILRPTDDS